MIFGLRSIDFLFNAKEKRKDFDYHFAYQYHGIRVLDSWAVRRWIILPLFQVSRGVG